MKIRWTGWIEWAFLAVLAVRPSLDVLTDVRFDSGPMRINAAALVGFFLLATGFAWLIGIGKDERRHIFTYPFTILLLLWVCLLLPWGLFSPELNGAPRTVATREWIRLLTVIPLFTVLFHLTRREGAGRLLGSLFVSLCIPALFGIYQWLFHQGAIIQGAHRIQGTFDHPNPFSFYLVLTIGLTLWKIRWTDRRIPWCALLVLEMGLLGATFSFTGAGMFGVMIVVFALGESHRRRKIALALIVVFTLLFLATPTGRQRIITVTQWDNLDEIERTGRETSSMVWRLLNWRFLVRTWKHQPWLGYGLNSSPTVNPNRKFNRTGPGQDPHNDYVRFLIDTGIIGEAMWLGLLTAIGLSLRRAYRTASTPECRHFVLTAGALYAAWLAGSFNDNLIAATAYQYSLWAVFAAAMGWSAMKSPPSDNAEGILQ